MKTKNRFGLTRAILPALADGEWHLITEIAELAKPFVLEGDSMAAATEMASQLKCERMGIRGRDDQQIRWRPDLYLEQAEAGHERIQFHSGATAVLRALLGLRSFQELIVQPGQQLNPAQRYWLDKALQMTNARIAEGG
jgi:hypothetical protein